MVQNQLSRNTAFTIATSVLGGLSWIPQQAREQLINQVTEYISTQGGRATQELTRYVQGQLSGFMDYAIGDGISQSRLQRDIQRAGRHLAQQSQQAANRARRRGELGGDILETENELTHREPNRQIQPYETDQQLMEQALNDPDSLQNRFNENMQGKSFHNSPWKAHK